MHLSPPLLSSLASSWSLLTAPPMQIGFWRQSSQLDKIATIIHLRIRRDAGRTKGDRRYESEVRSWTDRKLEVSLPRKKSNISRASFWGGERGRGIRTYLLHTWKCEAEAAIVCMPPKPHRELEKGGFSPFKVVSG